MRIGLFFIAAAAAYLIGGINPAIIISRAIYRVDVRVFGSHNPGFTNFKRVFGNDHAWSVFLIDFSKSALLCLLFGWLFRDIVGQRQLGVAFTSFFTLLGHAYPLWYHFQGGKGVAVMFAAIWFIEWRAAIIVLGVFLVMMVISRYMSLSVICGALTAPITMAVVGVEHPAAWFITIVCIVFMIIRHRENIKRLLRGTESRFSLKSVQKPPQDE